MNTQKPKLIISLITLLSIGLFSCSKSEEFSSTNKSNNDYIYNTRAEANTILSYYLELKNDEYILTISVDEAEDLGVPPHLYYSALAEIAETNAFIQKAKNDPSINLQLSDPKQELKSRSSRISTTSCTNPSGVLTTTGQE